MRRRPSSALPVVAVLVLAGTSIPTALVAQTPAGVLDEIALDYRTASEAWIGQVFAVTTDLFYWLALLEFVVAGLMYAIATPQAREAAAGRFLVKIMLISFVYMLITQSGFWLSRLIDSFAGVGEYVLGQTMSPSEIVAHGQVLSGAILRSVDLIGMVTNPPIVMYMTFTALIVMLCYIMIAVQVVLTLVKSYILLSAGLFFLAFGAFRSTASFAENYLIACVHVGIKLMILYFVTALGEPLTRTWAELLSDDRVYSTDVGPIIQVLAGAVMLAFIVWFIPGRIAGQITSGASLGLAAAMRGNA